MKKFMQYIHWFVFPLLLNACVSQPPSQDFNQQQAAKARVELALGYLSQQDFSLAKQNFDKALSYAPDYYLVHSGLAYFYQLQGKPEEAKQAYLKAIKLDNQQGDLFNNYGAFLCGQGEFAAAYQAFEQALNMPNYYPQADTYENLAICAFSAKDQERYQQNLQILQRIEPDRAKKLMLLLKNN